MSQKNTLAQKYVENVGASVEGSQSAREPLIMPEASLYQYHNYNRNITQGHKV